MNEADGGSEAWQGSGRSSTPNPLSTAPFELFIESVQDYAIFMLDPEGYVQTWNTGAERVKGYSAEEIIGEHFSVFYTPPDRARERPRKNLAIARREGRLEEEGWRRRNDGSRFWANVVITAVRDESGNLIGFGKVTRDLTERRRQEERERALHREQVARREAEAANRAKSEFLTTMSHELRTPLNAIIGYLDLMEQEIQGPLTDDQRTSLDRMRKSSKYLLRLVTDVLNFAGIQSGHADYDVQAVSVNDILDDLEPIITPQMRDKGIRFTCQRSEDEVTVSADPTKVRQILLNLLSNAHKFTPEDGEVFVDCVVEDDTARIRVRDTGSGIPAERQEAIFEPFVQVERHLQEGTRKGVGLGLAISRNIARAMGGDLTVESQPGQGSTFTLELSRSGRTQS